LALAFARAAVTKTHWRRSRVIFFSISLQTLSRISLLLFLLLPGFSIHAKDKPTESPALRWTEGKAGCTFSSDDDGKYRWGLSADDVRLTLAIDSHELQKLHRRVQPFFAVFLTIRYQGGGKLDFPLTKASLEYVKHFHVLKRPLGPDAFAASIQTDADEMEHQVERQMKKHPEQKEKLESQLQDYQRQVAELTEFLNHNSLRAHTLNPNNREASGWVFFSAKDKWIADWKKPEEFVLRVPLSDRLFEFPFTMPPAQADDLILRRRPN
jgi:hypothetical protein